MGNLHVVAKALARKATISNVSSVLCVLFRPRELLKKSSLQFAIYLKAVQRDGKLQSAACQTSADFQLSDLQADETNDKNQNIPHDLHITRQPYPLLELAGKDTSVMLSTL